jgi:hypothetical protein
VAYVGQTSSQKANAAGGKFRGRFGRIVFRNTGLYQHILKEGEGEKGPLPQELSQVEGGQQRADRVVAVNLVTCKILGLIPAAAVLFGSLQKEAKPEVMVVLVYCCCSCCDIA